MLVLALLDGIGPGGDGPHLLELAADGYVSESGRLERQNATDAWYRTTLAILPCSKHSCRSSLSVFVVLKGLRRRNHINEWLRRVQTEKLVFKLKTGLITSQKALLHTKHVLVGSQMLHAQQHNNVTTKEMCVPLYVIVLTIHTPTCSCQEGYPRSSVHGGRRTPPWHRSSLGCTAAQKKNESDSSSF